MILRQISVWALGDMDKPPGPGSRYGQLVVVAGSGRYKNRDRLWFCRCDCGQDAIMLQWNLTSGRSQSCGCGRSGRPPTHGRSRSPEYHAWNGMITRCTNERSAAWANYGGRGISVCARWLASFENFLADMGERPTSRHSVDRIDVNGHYEPSNCRWATMVQQANNRRGNRKLTALGETKTVSEWALDERCLVSYGTVLWRLSHGHSVADALFRPRAASGRRAASNTDGVVNAT